MVLPNSHEVPRASRYSGTDTVLFGFKYGTVTLSGAAFQPTSPAYSGISHVGPITPMRRISWVWPLPISLAATLGLSFDFLSSGY